MSVATSARAAGNDRAVWSGKRCVAVLGVAAVLVVGCVHNVDEPAGLPTATVTVSRIATLAALLPDEVAARGRLVIGVNLPQPPNQFRDSAGRIVGFDIDLITAVATILGLRADYRQADFEKIIPAVRAGGYDIGTASFTDTRERERVVDFVTYYATGTLWVQRAGSTLTPQSACGSTVAVQTATMADTHEVPAESAACRRRGLPPIEKVKFDRQDVATNALMLGRVAAMSADQPVSLWAIEQSGGRLVAAGEPSTPTPYGWPVAKDSGLAEPIRQALQHLIDTGDYRRIAAAWNLTSGMVSAAVINGALN